MSTRSELDGVRREAAAGRLREAAATCLEILKREPQDVDAIALYGDLAMDMHQRAEAVVIFRKLLEIDPKHSVAHERLAALAEQEGDYPAARTHAQTALQLNPQSLMALTVIASVLLAEGREQEALDALDSARELSPGHIGIEQAYADTLLEIGEFSRAGEVLKVLIRQHPGRLALVRKLSRTRRWQPGDPDEALIRGLLGPDGHLRPEHAADSAQAQQAYMALFKLESDQGNFDEAFKQLYAAKALAKKESPFDAAAQAHTFTRLKELYNEEFIRARQESGSTRDDPIFVVGMPRSGTTLVERMLSSSPNIVAAGELILAERVKEEVCAHFGANQYDMAALAQIPADVWRQMGEEYVKRAWKRLPQARHFVDKLPDNYQNLGLIHLMLPNARILHITRHPVANCLSIFEQDFAGGHFYNLELTTLGEQYLHYTDLMEHWRSIFGDRVVEVSYESLVSDPTGTADYLNQKLGIDIDLARLGDSQSSGKIRTASLWQARQGISTDSVERWRQVRKHLDPLLQVLAPILAEEDLK